MMHSEPCPYCAARCEADWTDVGVGYVQSGPFRCDVCSASKIGFELLDLDLNLTITDEERQTGWYRGPNQLDVALEDDELSASALEGYGDR